MTVFLEEVCLELAFRMVVPEKNGHITAARCHDEWVLNGESATLRAGKRDQTAQGERGSLLVFFCFLLILIFAAVAFSIDSTRLISAAQEKQNTAGFVALALVERYSAAIRESEGSFSPARHLDAFRAGVRRAIEVGQQNTLTARFVEKQLLAPADLVGVDDLNRGGRLGQIQSGRWFDQVPGGIRCNDFRGLDDFDAENRCPCGGAPCFVRCRNELGCRSVKSAQDQGEGEPAREPPNAFRVILRTSSERGGGIPLLFARVFGQLESAVERRATAVIIPRHFLLLQDLSRSVAVDSHLYFEKTGIVSPTGANRQPSEFAFRCAQGASSTSCTVADNPNVQEPPFTPSITVDPFNNPKVVWNNLKTGVCVAGEAITKGCYEQLGDGQTWYLVDRRGLGGLDAGGRPFGADGTPQPYTTMLLAANHLLSTFKEEHQVGDRVSLLGFGRDTGEKRTILLAEPRPGVESFERMLRLTTPEQRTLQERVEFRFFPGADGYYSDLPVALSRAQEALGRDPMYSSSQKHVFLITSGLTNCQRVEPRQGPPASGVPQCSGSIGDHGRSWREIYDDILTGDSAGRFEREGISLHVIQIGAVTGSHTVAVRMPGKNRCMRPDELLDFGILPTVSTPFTPGLRAFNAIGSGAGGSYYELSSALAAAARLTGGMYLPIRTNSQRCSSIPATSCPPIEPLGFRDALDKACAASPPPPRGVKDTALVNLKGAALAQTTSPQVPPAAYDADGRILCDPLCRDSSNRSDGQGPAQQLDKDLRAFVRRSPLSLVEETTTSVVN